MIVSGKTKVCAIIGDPVEHSLSPVMHNAAFKKMGLDSIYVPFLVQPEKLAQAVAGLRALNVVGFNVTIPHKVAILSLLDSLDPLAGKVGAVNTVVNMSGKLVGYNTDAEGFLQALMEHGIDPAGKKIIVLGAGGASRAISYVLAKAGANLTILNRKSGLTHAEAIAAIIRNDLGKTVDVLESGKITQAFKGVDVLVNATSVGMSPHSAVSPVPSKLLEQVPVVFDIVYNPMLTQLLKDAKSAGAKVIGGVDMLAWQGALAFEKWVGQKAPLELMRHEAVQILEKLEN